MRDLDDRRLSLGEHLRELRSCLRVSVIALVVAVGVTYAWSAELFALLLKPLARAAREAGVSEALHYGALTEPFWVYLRVSIYAGIFLASPVIFHQLWRFIAPGLYLRERRFTVFFAIFSALFFVGGAVFCYLLVFPAAFGFFISYASASIQPTLFMRPQLDLAFNLLLGFGLIFELPLLIFFLSTAGMVTHRGLWRWNKYAIVASFIVGAVLTPGPDVMTQTLMAVPLVVLYNLSIVIAYIVTKRREAKADPIAEMQGTEQAAKSEN